MTNSDVLAVEHSPPMTPHQVALYERIQAFSLDHPDAALPFSQRLANDNGWSLAYAQAVVEEYKKFTFLAIAADHPVTPSDQVDQAWHLHLTYTRSYWEEFCPHVLQTPLHHDPTWGGEAENQKFDQWYSKTLESYQQFFEQVPSEDIWPKPAVRFGRDLHFTRLNTQQNWVVSKLQVRRNASVAIATLLMLIGFYVWSVASNRNPTTGFLLGGICCAAGFGALRIFAGIVDFIRNPSAPRIGGCSGYALGTGCGGWGDYGHGGHSSGCGGAGCGGGGCGGGGCGGG